jgi:hypothetical protein
VTSGGRDGDGGNDDDMRQLHSALEARVTILRL